MKKLYAIVTFLLLTTNAYSISRHVDSISNISIHKNKNFISISYKDGSLETLNFYNIRSVEMIENRYILNIFISNREYIQYFYISEKDYLKIRRVMTE